MWQSFKDHIWEILIPIILTTLISVLGFAGRQYINDLYAQIDDKTKRLEALECRMTYLLALRDLTVIEQGLGSVALADISMDSPHVRGLEKFDSEYSSLSKSCPDKEFTSLIAQGTTLYEGIRKYNDPDFSAATQKFREITPPTSLSYVLVAESFLGEARKKEKSDPGGAADAAGNGRNELKNAIQRMNNELEDPSREHLISSLRCELLRYTQADRDKVIDCFMRLERIGAADHNSFLDLAVVYALDEKPELSVQNLENCIEADGGRYIGKYAVRTELASFFDHHSEYKSRFYDVLGKFK